MKFAVFATWHGVNGNREVDPVLILALCAVLMLRRYGGSRSVSSLKVLLEPVVNIIELGVHAFNVVFDLAAIAPNAWLAITEKSNGVNDVRSLIDSRKS